MVPRRSEGLRTHRVLGCGGAGPGAAGASGTRVRYGAGRRQRRIAVALLLLFVGGVMNRTRLAVLGVVVPGEKFAPAHRRPERYAAAAPAAGAVLVLLRG